uniref:ACOX domain-containing protein n=1 Tax=Onchocerca ochengi TaxID=42157 RepID=A0A182ERS4_ONCOC
GIEQCRLACGGHGFSLASALPEIYSFAVAGCTYEGENIVMLLQVARFLMKTVKEIRSSSARLAAIAKYLLDDRKYKSNFRVWHMVKYEDLIEDFEQVTRNQVTLQDCIMLTERVADGNVSIEEFRNKLLNPNYFSSCERSIYVLGVSLATWNLIYLIAIPFLSAECIIREKNLKIYSTFDYLQQLQKDNHSPEEAWNCASVELCQASRDDYMSDEQMKNIKCGIYEILGKLRPDAVAIVDSFDFSDRELHSVLGRRDGNVYAAMLEWAKHSELNKTEVLSTFEKYLGPMMKCGRSKI